VASLTDKLKGLYARAILRPEEENDTGRLNEARNAAFLLLKIARENGVQLKFIANPGEKRGETTAEANPQAEKPAGPKRYERPKPASPPVRKRAQPGAGYDYDYDAAGWKTCPCGKPIATRTWFSPFAGCTHVEQDGSPVT
jgi:hypothetical protein